MNKNIRTSWYLISQPTLFHFITYTVRRRCVAAPLQKEDNHAQVHHLPTTDENEAEELPAEEVCLRLPDGDWKSKKLKLARDEEFFSFHRQDSDEF